MALVTGFTAERSLAMEAATIIDGHIDGDGHLILTQHDGTDIDAGYALVATPDATSTGRGIVELATEAETTAHSDSVRAVTPASLAATFTRIADLETESGERVALITTVAESAAQSAYPAGVSLMTLVTGDAWSINSSQGTVVTANISATRCVQTVYSSAGGTQFTKTWVRSYHSSNGGGGWTAWGRLSNPNDPTSVGMTGEIKMWPTSTIPAGWLVCDGSAISRTTYAALFTTLGTVYGVGDGTTTFGIPNMKGRMPVGYDSTQTEFDSTGETGGAKTHTLTTAEMPVHTHIQNAHSHATANAGNVVTDGATGTIYALQGGSSINLRPSTIANTTAVNQDAGSGSAHNNLPPYLTVRFIIKT